MSTRSKWLDWKPDSQETSILEKTARCEPQKPQKPTPIFLETAKTEPQKPKKPGSLGFLGPPLANFPKIEVKHQPPPHQGEDNAACECKAGSDDVLPESTQAQVDAAGEVLAKAGVRLIGGVHGADYAGIWSDLDGPEVRAAIAVFHPDGVPIRYLDGDVPMRFKLRRAPGEPVPANVLAAMKREPDEPWKVRDKMLAEMGWTSEPTPWPQYQAERLNELFRGQGATGQPGKIRSETVRYGERGRK